MTQQKRNLQDPAAERAILAGICRYGRDGYFEVSDVVNSQCFTIDVNQFIYDCLTHALETVEKVDISTILTSANTLGCNEVLLKDDGLDYINALFCFDTELGNIRHYAKKIRKLQVARTCQDKAKKAFTKLGEVTGNESIDEILAILETPVFDLIQELNSGVDSGPSPIGEGLDEYVEFLEENQDRSVGVSTGYKYFDNVIGGGLRRKTVNLIGARKKVGKTQLAVNMGIYIAEKTQIPVLYLDTEMDKESIWSRLLGNFGDIDVTKVEKGQFKDIQALRSRLHQAKERIKNSQFHYVNVSGKPFEEILSIVRRWLMKTVKYDANGRMNDCVLVYDYFKLMGTQPLESMQEYQAIGFQVSRLHDFCTQYDFPVLSFVQLNREFEISQSDRLSWFCTSIAYYMKKTPEEIAQDGIENGNRKLVVEDARHGPGQEEGDYINFAFDGYKARITELGTKSQILKRKAEDESFYDFSDDEDDD